MINQQKTQEATTYTKLSFINSIAHGIIEEFFPTTIN